MQIKEEEPKDNCSKSKPELVIACEDESLASLESESEGLEEESPILVTNHYLKRRQAILNLNLKETTGAKKYIHFLA